MQLAWLRGHNTKWNSKLVEVRDPSRRGSNIDPRMVNEGGGWSAVQREGGGQNGQGYCETQRSNSND